MPTTPDTPTTGVLHAFTTASVGVGDVETFTHGTTLGLNALLTRTGARTAVVGTRGFRDVYLLGRTDRRTSDPERVAADVRDGFVSVTSAARDYGVAVDPVTFEVDSAETARLRGRRDSSAGASTRY